MNNTAIAAGAAGLLLLALVLLLLRHNSRRPAPPSTSEPTELWIEPDPELRERVLALIAEKQKEQTKLAAQNGHHKEQSS